MSDEDCIAAEHARSMKNRTIVCWLWLGLVICLLDAAPAHAFYNPQQGADGVGGLLAVSYHGSATTNCFAAYDGNGNVAKRGRD
jgi:hypothetical protein